MYSSTTSRKWVNANSFSYYPDSNNSKVMFYNYVSVSTEDESRSCKLITRLNLMVVSLL